MTILEHLEELRKRAFKVLWTLLPLFIFYVTFAIRWVEVSGIPIPYPWPDFYGAVSIQVVKLLMDTLLPEFVQRVQLHPAEAIIVQFKVSIFLAVLTSMPMIVYQASKFLAPGLHAKERETIAKITVPATLLFVLGVALAYVIILPIAFEFLYGVGLSMGLTPFVGPDQFFDMVLLFFLGMGLAFQTPIIMWGLTALGVIEPGVWKKYWRVALVAFFFFGALITPDGSGITMLLVAIPMTGLYAVGYVMANRTWEDRQGLRVKEDEKKSNYAVWSVVIILLLALTGGFLYYNRAIFSPPVEVSDTLLGTGNVSMALPAFVLYSPDPLAPDMHSKTTLRITNNTTIVLRWSAMSASGQRVAFASATAPGGPFSATENTSTFAAHPALWTGEGIRSLTVTVTEGNAAVYTLGIRVNYQIFQRREFSDVNRNGLLDPDETVQRESLLFKYDVLPESPSLQVLGESGVPLPSTEQLTLATMGVFSAVGPGWTLETSMQELQVNNTTYSYTMAVEDQGLDALGVTLYLSRSFQWSGEGDLKVWLSGESATQFTYLWYVDTRFGAIYPVLQTP